MRRTITVHLRWSLLLLCMPLLFGSGCMKREKSVVKLADGDSVDLPSPAQSASLGSLWDENNGRAYLFQDLRASRVGDVIVVKIVEQQSGSKRANTTADRESTYNNSLGGNFFGLNNLASAFVDGVEIDASTKNEFEGAGSTSREDTLTGTIAARVTEVMPNGDLRIKGKREVTVNSEKQTMTITGIVRRIDLDTKNTVLSTRIAEAKIEYTGLGVVDDVQRPGWLVRLLDWFTWL